MHDAKLAHQDSQQLYTQGPPWSILCLTHPPTPPARVERSEVLLSQAAAGPLALPVGPKFPQSCSLEAREARVGTLPPNMATGEGVPSKGT